MTALSHWSGDIACAQAAEAAGIRYTLSGACSYSPEEVAAATKEKHWFQLYCFGDRDTVGKLIERAQSAGYTALFLTVDVPVRGHRESETRTGSTVPPTLTLGTAWDFMRHPSWTWGVLSKKRTVPVLYAEMEQAKARESDLQRAARVQARMMMTDLNWDDLRWVRDLWKGRLYVKGCSIRTMPSARSRSVPMGWSCRTMAAASSTMRWLRSMRCRRSASGSARAARCCWMAASAVAAISSRRCAWVPTECSSAVPMSMGSRPAAGRASRT